ncbi:MAG: DAK2 domain-containing protein [Oscillospiraceae bacterium]|nr:DAK2 domain-containing protein [Oscillospiraceae bacterium]MBR4101098.1 DAK2 domain-containing protein [Oscillospiraceae bacterium]
MNGKLLKDALCSAAVTIEKNRKAIDELNVYPVPDGDTGTNMSMTMSAARRELMVMPDTSTVSEIADKAASAMLRGARGNSGVILSLLFRGFSKGLAGLETAEGTDLANALEIGVQAAYKSVMKPTEGTILTVARMGAQQAQLTARENNDPVVVWEETCKAAAEALAKTPEQLPILKKAGVVDAGGKGLLTVWEAMLAVMHGEAPAEVEAPAKSEAPTVTAIGRVDMEEEINFTYCTEFIVEKRKDCPDAFKLRAYLETIGDCVVVVDDDEIIKVHVHTDTPGLALQKALEFGYFINDPKPKIENMRIQHAGRVREAKNAAQDETYVRAEPEKPFGFVAVAAGDGLENMFKDLGVDCVVRGGQTMNPSTDDILRAVHATPAKNVFVLPNNKNIIMAAEQAVSLADRNVCVLQTRTIPQGMSAMLAFDDSLSLDENRTAMTKAFEKVSTGQITFAARDSELDGTPIKKGEVMALDNGKLSFVDKDLNHAAYRLTKRLVNSDTGFVTVMHGADVSEETAEQLVAKLQSKFGDRIEIMLVNGGQPVYYYIISAE